MNDSSITAEPAGASWMPAAARFTQPQEFAAEVRRDKRAVHRGLVRLTFQSRADCDVPYNELFVVAGYLLDSGPGGWQLVELRHLCGPLWHLGDDQEVQRRADSTYATIEQAIADAGLECRPGQLVLTDSCIAARAACEQLAPDECGHAEAVSNRGADAS
jgi:hypothetical protein